MPSSTSFASAARRLARAPRLVGALVLVATTALVAGLWAMQEHAAQEALLRHRAQLRLMMDADTPAAYRQVVHQGHALLARGRPDGATQEMVAYAATILAVEHQDEDSLAVSRAIMQQHNSSDAASDLEGAEGYLTAARILASYGEGDLTEGLALAESVRGVAEGRVMARLEGLRLMVAAKLEAPKIAATVSDLGNCVGEEVRALNYLGLWHLSQGNTAQGEAYLLRAQRFSPSHPQVMLGLQWARLFAAHPPPEDVWRAQQTAGDVLRLDSRALSPPIRATALLVRAQASMLEGDAPRAERDRAEAMGLDPGNLLHEATRDAPARP